LKFENFEQNERIENSAKNYFFKVNYIFIEKTIIHLIRPTLAELFSIPQNNYIKVGLYPRINLDNDLQKNQLINLDKRSKL
jgi:hypothetical protein